MRDGMALVGAAVAVIVCCATLPLVIGAVGAATLGAWTAAGLAGVGLLVAVVALVLRRRRASCDGTESRV